MGCEVKKPCAKFIVAAAVTCGSLIFGCTMIATSGATAPLTPFYCSLITGAVAYWATPVGYEEKNETKNETKNDYQKIED